MPGIISRERAAALGLRFYYRGSPCQRGHFAERYTSTGNCAVCLSMTGKARYVPRPKRVKPLSALQIAKAAGQKRYSTCKPCRHGHVAERRTVDGDCTECARLRRVRDRDTKSLYVPPMGGTERC
jgi:hypothetical protein